MQGPLKRPLFLTFSDNTVVESRAYTKTAFFYDLRSMLDNRYETVASEAFRTFVFTSEGPKGNVKKVVRYTEINLKDIYNLGYGDQDPVTEFISDTSRTDNKDSLKVLATVVSTLYLFLEACPEATVIAAGSTEARTRLYRMGITANLTAITQNFELLGLTENGWQDFEKDVNYGAFLVRRKTVNL